MKDYPKGLRVQTSFFRSIIDWSSVDLIRLTLINRNSNLLLHQALCFNAEEQTVYSSKHVPNTYCDLIITNCEPFLIAGNSNEDLSANFPLKSKKCYEAYIGVPVAKGEGCIGALELMSITQRFWKTEEQTQLHGYANVISKIIESDL